MKTVIYQLLPTCHSAIITVQECFDCSEVLRDLLDLGAKGGHRPDNVLVSRVVMDSN